VQADLRLEWNEHLTFGRVRSASQARFLFFVNRGTSTWEDDGGEYWAFIGVYDASTGEQLPSHGATIGGGGRTYRLAPGARVAVPAVFATDLADLPAGRYDLEAVIAPLSLRSDRRSVDLPPT
jgi:hypothetical protein